MQGPGPHGAFAAISQLYGDVGFTKVPCTAVAGLYRRGGFSAPPLTPLRAGAQPRAGRQLGIKTCPRPRRGDHASNPRNHGREAAGRRESGSRSTLRTPVPKLFATSIILRLALNLTIGSSDSVASPLYLASRLPTIRCTSLYSRSLRVRIVLHCTDYCSCSEWHTFALLPLPPSALVLVI